jgi:hypothetical protein
LHSTNLISSGLLSSDTLGNNRRVDSTRNEGNKETNKNNYDAQTVVTEVVNLSRLPGLRGGLLTHNHRHKEPQTHRQTDTKIQRNTVVFLELLQQLKISSVILLPGLEKMPFLQRICIFLFLIFKKGPDNMCYCIHRIIRIKKTLSKVVYYRVVL